MGPFQLDQPHRLHLFGPVPMNRHLQKVRNWFGQGQAKQQTKKESASVKTAENQQPQRDQEKSGFQISTLLIAPMNKSRAGFVHCWLIK